MTKNSSDTNTSLLTPVPKKPSPRQAAKHLGREDVAADARAQEAEALARHPRAAGEAVSNPRPPVPHPHRPRRLPGAPSGRGRRGGELVGPEPKGYGAPSRPKAPSRDQEP